ncbi:helix-turn-helix transcriptional regulator [Pseudoflavonifractor sp. 524-17]|uniref:helix-turn-helix domain-containing protein n=1 Tax=Pseudoflavonifractor sp. 524-17 TaxID=2304577 RepID=UPI00137A0E51|nr:helix-turn-helix transcriptional regulator [Pseudoflavonifractor sp. 524-17]
MEKIKALCKERGVSLQEVGRSCGFGEKSIYAWGEKPPAAIERVKRVADYFGVTVDELLADTST